MWRRPCLASFSDVTRATRSDPIHRETLDKER
jgi:hypothetical protein